MSAAYSDPSVQCNCTQSDVSSWKSELKFAMMYSSSLGEYNHNEMTETPSKRTSIAARTPNRRTSTIYDDDNRRPESPRKSRAGNDREAAEEIAYSRINSSNENPTVSSTEPTLLFSLIKARKWSDVVKKTKKDRTEAGTWIVERNVDGSIRWKLLPLHQACESQAPSEVVSTLLDAYPPAVIMKDSGGDLPLHLACRERASKKVIEVLLAADSDAAKVADDEGRLPLHLACRQGAGLEIVDNLLIAYHRAARTPDSYSLLPLHWACAQNAAPPVIESLLRANPEAVEKQDKWGRTPLSLAQASTNSHKQAVITALNRDASYWTTSLLEEVDNLKVKLSERTESEKNTTYKAKSLEDKLHEVTTASTMAAQSFRELKDELQTENAFLNEKVLILTAKNNQADDTIDRLTEENGKLKKTVRELTSRLDALTSIFRTMEDQRLQVLKVTGNWENSLHEAADIINNLDEC